MQNRVSLEINQSLVGSEVEVLVEGTSKSDAQMLTGKTRTNKTVPFAGTRGVDWGTGQVELLKHRPGVSLVRLI